MYACCITHNSVHQIPPPPSPSLVLCMPLECIDIDAAVATVASAAADELLLCLESLNWTPHSILHRNVWPWAVTIYRRLFFRCTFKYTFTIHIKTKTKKQSKIRAASRIKLTVNGCPAKRFKN